MEESKARTHIARQERRAAKMEPTGERLACSVWPDSRIKMFDIFVVKLSQKQSLCPEYACPGPQVTHAASKL